MVIDDDGPFEHAGVLADEGDQFGDRHIIEVDMLLLDDLAPAGDDVIGAVLAFADELLQIFRLQIGRENILDLIGDVLLIKPFPDFPATRATGGNVNLDHA